MKAASVRAKGRFGMEELPVPEPGPGMVLLKVLYCSICGSDVERVYGPVWERAPETAQSVIAGSILGHEWVGRVKKLGEGVDQVAVGDRTVDTHLPCGLCYYCVRGMSELCMGGRVRGHPYDGSNVTGPGRWGAFAEYVLRPARRLLKVPESVPDQVAAMTEPLATGVAAVHHSGIRTGDSAVIIGAGHIGLCTLAATRAAGAAPIIATDRADARLEIARRMGADMVFNPDTADVVKAAVDATEAGPDVVMTCVSGQAPGVLEQAFEMVRRDGQVVLVGPPAPAALPTGQWLTKEVSVKGVVHMGEKMFPALKLIENGRVNLAPMITEVVPLAEVQRGFESLREGRNIAVLVQP